MKVISCIIMLFAFVIMYFILCKVFASLFQLTGLSKSKSRFQAYSLFIGCGFTTSESELIMYDPTRRKLAIACSITGFIFSTLIIGLVIGVVGSLDFHGANSAAYTRNIFLTFGLSLACLIIIIILSNVKVVANACNNLLKKIFFRIHHSNGDNVIIFTDMIYDQFIAAIELNKVPSHLAGRRFADIDLENKYGIKILICGKKDIGMTAKIDEDYIFSDGLYLQVMGPAKAIKTVFAADPEIKD